MFYNKLNIKVLSKTMSLKNLPMDVVINILYFDGRFRVSGGEIINLLDKNKYKDVIHFLLNKPLPNFRAFAYGLREKYYAVDLSQNMHIHYNLNYDIHNKIVGMEIRLWKRYQFINKVICK